MRHDIDINKIAAMLTDDPDIFIEDEKPKTSKKGKKRKKRNEAETEVFGKEFEIHDGLDDERDEPAEPGEQKRPPADGPTGQEGSESSPYLKPASK